MECLAIGSLPYNNPKEAIKIVEQYFNNIPFWPQLAKVSKNEDMTVQFLEGMPLFFSAENFYFNTEDEKFFEQLENFIVDYEEITENKNTKLLDKYKISEDFSSAFPLFLDLIDSVKPEFAKGQIVGPFTLATTLLDQNGKCAIYDDTLREIIVKILTLKALWQIREIKQRGAKPIIFIDEPSLSQLGTSAYLTISENDVVSMLSEIVTNINKNGGISAIHCCGKCNWNIPIKAGINMISADSYTYSKNLAIFSESINKFLKQNGKIVWGLVPTLDKDALKQVDLDLLTQKFYKDINYLTKKGINEKLILDNSFISPSCGAGSLPLELAEKAMRLTKDLSEVLKGYNDN